MKKNIFGILCVLLLFVLPLAAQTKPRLAVLPFTGGNGLDGNTLALLLSNEPVIRSSFTVVPRNDNLTTAIFKEQNIQRSGLTDSDTISALGKQMNADFVVAGHIQKLGTKNLVLVTIVNVETLQQIAGDYREYQKIDEMLQTISSMAKRIVDASQTDTESKLKLAVLPFDIPAEVNQTDAEVLAQLLATEIANTGKYAVLPRTKTIDEVMKEQKIQRSGLTDVNSIKAIGKATNAQYVLAGSVVKLGATNLFLVQILNIETAELVEGNQAVYSAITDGLKLMPELSHLLTGIKQGEKATIPQKIADKTDTAVRKDPSQPTTEASLQPNKNFSKQSFFMLNDFTSIRFGAELLFNYTNTSVIFTNLHGGGFGFRLIPLQVIAGKNNKYFDFQLGLGYFFSRETIANEIFTYNELDFLSLKIGGIFSKFAFHTGITATLIFYNIENIMNDTSFGLSFPFDIQYRLNSNLAIVMEYRLFWNMFYYPGGFDTRSTVSVGILINRHYGKRR